MRIRYTIAAAVAALGAVSALAAPAGAAAVHDPSSGSVHDQTEVIVDSVPCAGDFIITLNYNATQHDVSNKNGDWATFTQTGTFDASVPVTITARDADGNATAWIPRTGETFTGHFTIWGNFNLNRQNYNGSFTFDGHGVGSAGTPVSWHENDHFNTSPGDITRAEFNKLACH